MKIRQNRGTFDSEFAKQRKKGKNACNQQSYYGTFDSENGIFKDYMKINNLNVIKYIIHSNSDTSIQQNYLLLDTYYRLDKYRKLELEVFRGRGIKWRFVRSFTNK